MSYHAREQAPHHRNQAARPILRQRFTVSVPWIESAFGPGPSVVTIETLITDEESHDIVDLQEAGWESTMLGGLFVHTRIVG